MRSIIVIAHNIRSSHNIGSLLRTCDGIGASKIYLTGYSPYPKQSADDRLPHIADKIDQQIHKTALGAEANIDWEHYQDVSKIIDKLKSKNYLVAALEQSKDSIKLPKFQPPQKIALILGNEVTGLDSSLLSLVSACLEIPMFGKKESYNVVQAAAMALFHLRFSKDDIISQ